MVPVLTADVVEEACPAISRRIIAEATTDLGMRLRIVEDNITVQLTYCVSMMLRDCRQWEFQESVSSSSLLLCLLQWLVDR